VVRVPAKSITVGADTMGSENREMRNSEIRLHVRAQGKQSPTATLIDHGELSARRKRSRNGLGGDVLEADFWGSISGE
jgi:hypothetical protein